MRAIRKIQTVDKDGKLLIEIPKEFGSKVEVIILPIQPATKAKQHLDWTDEEWQEFSLHSLMNTEDDRDIEWEEFFDVRDR